MTEDAIAPRVSICIPLYAARPWTGRIVDNIVRNAAPDVEFVLSDRHGLDDAIEIIAQRAGEQARVRCYSSRSGGGWIDNYNFLLREARGDYIRILTQDDVLPEQSLGHARSALDADPTTGLIVGPADLIDTDGQMIWRDVRLAPSTLPPIGRVSTIDALRLFAGSRYRHANLGLIRRAIVANARLSIPETTGASGLSVRALLFALALRGRVRYQPGYVSQRCVHPASYTARHASRSAIDEWRRARSYWQAGTSAWQEAAGSRSARFVAAPILGAAVAHLVARRALQRFTAEVRIVAERQRHR